MFLSAADIEESVVVEVADVAGRQPSVCGHAGFGSFGILVVAEHYILTLDIKDAGLGGAVGGVDAGFDAVDDAAAGCHAVDA